MSTEKSAKELVPGDVFTWWDGVPKQVHRNEVNPGYPDSRRITFHAVQGEPGLLNLHAEDRVTVHQEAGDAVSIRERE